MSKLNFSARALPRDEITDEDPAPAAVPATPAANANTPPESAESAEPAASGLISKLAGLFRR
jgi:hypothetical protein